MCIKWRNNEGIRRFFGEFFGSIALKNGEEYGLINLKASSGCKDGRLKIKYFNRRNNRTST